MNPWVRKLNRELGVDKKKAQKAWDEAVTIAEDMHGKAEESFDTSEFEFAYETAKDIVRKTEIRHSITDFIESGKSAREYIESVTSGDFSVLDTHYRRKDKDDDEDEDEEQEKLNSPTVVYEKEHGDDEDDSKDNEEDDDSDEDEEDEDDDKEKDESTFYDHDAKKIAETVKASLSKEEIASLKSRLQLHLENQKKGNEEGEFNKELDQVE